jgi:preprotein translocase subunit SecD
MIKISRWQVFLIVGLCLLGIVAFLPTILPRATLEALPGWLPGRQVPLGLDLRGGSHLLLEVDTKAVAEEDLGAAVEAVRSSLRQVQIGYRNLGSQAGHVLFQLVDPSQAGRAREVLRELRTGMAIESLDDGTFRLRPTEEAVLERQRSAVEQSIEIVRRRIDETGAKDPNIQRHGRDRIVVQLPGVDDPERIKRLLGKTAKMSFHLLDSSTPFVEAGTVAPPGTAVLPSDSPGLGGAPIHYLVRKRVEVSGDRLIDAQATFQDNEPVVSFRFDTAGAKRFADTTQQHVREYLAIVLDGKVISAPVIREPILGGNGIISGSFTTESAKDLALLLRAGALPAPLQVLEERTVGPDLGADSIRAGAVACLIGYILIAVLMVVSYGLFGLVANLALMLNLIFTLAIMAALSATLTLPGIAGMVLGLAMAVDANVLIYERMREEMRIGRSPFPAVDMAFQRAFGTILDSNLTTLIAALFLYFFGSGPVRGFAVTLSIAILCSMFTSVTVTRLTIVTWLKWARPKALPI